MRTTRRFVAMMIGAAIAGSFGLTVAAGAAPTSTTAAPTSVAISGDYAFSGAEVTGPGLAAPRAMSAYQAAVWVQSWLGDLYYGKPRHQAPPAGVAVYRVDVTGTWGGDQETRSTFYATDGTTAWVAFPSTLHASTPPAASWFVGTPRVPEAFAGTASLVPTGGTATPTTRPGASSTTDAPTTTRPATAAGGGHTSHRSTWLWVAAVLAVIGAVALLASWFRDRSRSHAEKQP